VVKVGNSPGAIRPLSQEGVGRTSRKVAGGAREPPRGILAASRAGRGVIGGRPRSYAKLTAGTFTAFIWANCLRLFFKKTVDAHVMRFEPALVPELTPPGPLAE